MCTFSIITADRRVQGTRMFAARRRRKLRMCFVRTAAVGTTIVLHRFSDADENNITHVTCVDTFLNA